MPGTDQVLTRHFDRSSLPLHANPGMEMITGMRNASYTEYAVKSGRATDWNTVPLDDVKCKASYDYGYSLSDLPTEDARMFISEGIDRHSFWLGYLRR